MSYAVVSDESNSAWIAAGSAVTALGAIALAWVRGWFGDQKERREAHTVWQEQMVQRMAGLEAHDRERQAAFEVLSREHAELSGRHAGLMFAKELLASEMAELRETNAMIRERLAQSEQREKALKTELDDLYRALDAMGPGDPLPTRRRRHSSSS